MPGKRFFYVIFLFFTGITSIGQVFALDWEASIEGGEIYTDNVELSTDELAADEWITRVSPALELTHVGKRLDLSIDYALEALYYSDVSERNQVFNQLESLALYDLISDALRLRGEWSIGQFNVNPDLPLTSSNINLTGNRTDAITWAVGPEWEQRMGGFAEIDAYYLFGAINYDDVSVNNTGPALQDVETRRALFTLRSDSETVSTFSWELKYTNDQILYDLSSDVEIQAATALVGYQLGSDFRLTVLGGADSDYTNLADASLSENRWEVGMDAQFNNNVFTAAFGRRFFGNTYRFSWNRDQADRTFRVSYREDPSNTELLILQRAAPEEGIPTPPDAELGRPGSATRFIFKRADAGSQWRLFRSTVDINLFWENRENIPTQESIGDPAQVTGDEESYGARLDFRWELGTKTIVSFGGDWQRREVVRFDSAVNDQDRTDEFDLASISAGIDYTLGLKTSVSIYTSYLSRVGATSNISEYQQFMVDLRIKRIF